MKILGIDYGSVRTGIAVSDDLTLTAQGLSTISEAGMKKLAEKVALIAAEENADEIVLGFPKNMNGTVGERGEKTKRFKELLETLLSVPVILWDERLTTVYAHNIMNAVNVRGKKRKNEVDRLAATIILQDYLDMRRNKT